ncbi:MAG: UDP-glucuronic acid decarboxylase family protein [bacterium]
MKILITGGAGFLGSHLCDFFIKKGAGVIAMDNLITGNLDNISHIKDPKFRFINYDVNKYIEIKEKIDFIFHFASCASPMDYIKYPIQTLKTGALGTHNTLGLAKAKSAGYVLASSSEVYGDPLVNPQPEDYWGNVNPIGPRGVYDESKRFAEAMVMSYHRIHNIDTRIVRIFNTYGERMRTSDGRCIPAFIPQALKNEPLTIFGDGMQTRSFCYVDDLMEGIFLLMNKKFHNPVNLGNPEERTIKDIASRIIELTKSKSSLTFCPLPEDDPKVRRPDITLAKNILGFSPKVSLEEGLLKTIDWFRKIIK